MDIGYYFTPFFEVTQLAIGQMGDTCRNIALWEYPIIIAMIVGSGVFLLSSGVGVMAIATTLVNLIVAGASIFTIAAALGGDVALTSSSLEGLGVLIIAIKKYLGC
jgi:hypothetical protein